MNDGSIEMAKQWSKDVVKYPCLIQNLEQPHAMFDTVFGCWVFCYLNKGDRAAAIKGIRNCLKPGGHLIMFEPILGPNSTMLEVDHEWKEQRMKIR